MKTNKGEDRYLLGLERYGNLWYSPNKEHSDIEGAIQEAKDWSKKDVSTPVCIIKTSVEVIAISKKRVGEIAWGGYSYATLDIENLKKIDI